MDQPTKPKPRDFRVAIGVGIAAVLVVVGLKVTSSNDNKAAQTPIATLPPTTLLPMVTASPYHETPNPAEWRTWLAANAKSFGKARANFVASQAGTGPSAARDDADVEQWTGALLAQPIPADPIGQRLTASLTALRGVAIAHQRPAENTASTDGATSFDAEVIKGNTLLQSALADLTALGVLDPA
jgi:hypothetical protein